MSRRWLGSLALPDGRGKIVSKKLDEFLRLLK